MQLTSESVGNLESHVHSSCLQNMENPTVPHTHTILAVRIKGSKEAFVSLIFRVKQKKRVWHPTLLSALSNYPVYQMRPLLDDSGYCMILKNEMYYQVQL